MKLTTDLAAHGHEHEFSVMFKQVAAQILGLRVLKTELAHEGEVRSYSFHGLFQKRVCLLSQWAEKFKTQISPQEATALGYYLMGLIVSVGHSAVRPRDYGSTNIGSLAWSTRLALSCGSIWQAGLWRRKRSSIRSIWQPYMPETPHL